MTQTSFNSFLWMDKLTPYSKASFGDNLNATVADKMSLSSSNRFTLDETLSGYQCTRKCTSKGAFSKKENKINDLQSSKNFPVKNKYVIGFVEKMCCSI